MKHQKPQSQKADTVQKGKKTKYRITNWKEYNRSLINRGSLTLWISSDVEESWYAGKTGQPGSPKKYSDQSIETILTIQQLYSLPLRAIQDFTESLFALMNTTLDVPNYTTLSRRNPSLAVRLRKSDKNVTDMVVDSTGIKVYGEGEWKVRKHGVSKRRTWKKVHIGIDEKGELRAVAVTQNDTHDSEVIPPLLCQETATLTDFYADGAYDTRSVYDALIARGVDGVHIPPQKNAKIWQHGNSSRPPHPPSVLGCHRLWRYTNHPLHSAGSCRWCGLCNKAFTKRETFEERQDTMVQMQASQKQAYWTFGFPSVYDTNTIHN
jgi:hypothetical protein